MHSLLVTVYLQINSLIISLWLSKKGSGSKGSGPHTQGTQVRITLQITPYLPLPRKHSPDGACPD